MSKFFTKLKVKEVENIIDFDPATVIGCVGSYTFNNILNLGEDTSGLNNDGNQITFNFATNIKGPNEVSKELVSDFTSGGILELTNPEDFVYPNFSISFWFKISALGTGSTILNINQGTTVNKFEITTVEDKLQYNLTLNSVLTISGKSSATYTDDNWHHVVIILGSNGNKLYIDNSQITVDYSGGVGDSSNTSCLSNFTATPTSSQFGSGWGGYFDNVTFYNKELSVQEILELYDESSEEITTLEPNKIVNNIGTVSNPSYTFTTEESTGIYLPSAGQLGLTVSGENRLLIDTTLNDETTILRFGQISQDSVVGYGNYFYFGGTQGDEYTDGITTCIGERIYSADEKSELVLFKGNDANNSFGYDRIRMRACGELLFQCTDTTQYFNRTENEDDSNNNTVINLRPTVCRIMGNQSFYNGEFDMGTTNRTITLNVTFKSSDLTHYNLGVMDITITGVDSDSSNSVTSCYKYSMGKILGSGGNTAWSTSVITNDTTGTNPPTIIIGGGTILNGSNYDQQTITIQRESGTMSSFRFVVALNLVGRMYMDTVDATISA